MDVDEHDVECSGQCGILLLLVAFPESRGDEDPHPHFPACHVFGVDTLMCGNCHDDIVCTVYECGEDPAG